MPRQTAEQLFRALFRGPATTQAASRSNQWAGRTTLNSGSATVTVSTTIVDSDSIILLGQEIHTTIASGLGGRGIEVKCISPGNFFTLGSEDGQAPARDTKIMWKAFKTQ